MAHREHMPLSLVVRAQKALRSQRGELQDLMVALMMVERVPVGSELVKRALQVRNILFLVLNNGKRTGSGDGSWVWLLDVAAVSCMVVLRGL
jgi:hypothetical protein